MEVYHIDVTYDVETGLLTVEQEQVTIAAPAEGDATPSVLWRFDGIDELLRQGYVAGIWFAESEYGPFTNLCNWPTEVAGCGNDGVSGTQRYEAVLVPPGGEALIQSQPCQLTNQVSVEQADGSPVVSVTVVDGDSPLLEVHPQSVGRLKGQSLIWRVVGDVPVWLANSYPRVVFSDGPVGSSASFGPFEGWDRFEKTLIGAGQGGEPGVYSYRFQLVSFDDGRVVIQSSPDPTVDDRGEPPVGNVYAHRARG